jgi:putative endonuclease
MAQHNQTGKEGEEAAVQYLLQHGYDVIERNWRHQRLEVDIIARKGEILSIVEVKTRTGNFFGEPYEAVTKQKEKFLADAADHYVVSRNLDVEVRYDIASVTVHNGQSKVVLIEDAFYPYM